MFAPSTVVESATAASATTDWTRGRRWTTQSARRPAARGMSRRAADPRRWHADLTGFPAAAATSTTTATSDTRRARRRFAPGRLLADSGTATTGMRRHNAHCLDSVWTRGAWFILLRHESSATATVILRTPPDAASREMLYYQSVSRFAWKKFLCNVQCASLLEYFQYNY